MIFVFKFKLNKKKYIIINNIKINNNINKVIKVLIK